jgi:hypothetical protein
MKIKKKIILLTLFIFSIQASYNKFQEHVEDTIKFFTYLKYAENLFNEIKQNNLKNTPISNQKKEETLDAEEHLKFIKKHLDSNLNNIHITFEQLIKNNGDNEIDIYDLYIPLKNLYNTFPEKKLKESFNCDLKKHLEKIKQYSYALEFKPKVNASYKNLQELLENLEKNSTSCSNDTFEKINDNIFTIEKHLDCYYFNKQIQYPYLKKNSFIKNKEIYSGIQNIETIIKKIFLKEPYDAQLKIVQNTINTIKKKNLTII